jgi:hypothetical protein
MEPISHDGEGYPNNCGVDRGAGAEFPLQEACYHASSDKDDPDPAQVLG